MYEDGFKTPNKVDDSFEEQMKKEYEEGQKILRGDLGPLEEGRKDITI